jgi:hypothetical protein
VLFVLFGSSGAGKTSALDALRERAPERLALHDFDEVGVPRDADTAWRQRTNEDWVRRALELQADGVDLLLAGQTPYGEVLAAPSADRLEVVGCLLDVDEDVRLDRLGARGGEWLERSGLNLPDLLAWAEWMRGHARDPQHRQHVIRRAGDPSMRWVRWADWREGDPRWRVRVLDTTALPIEAVADALLAWVAEERARSEEAV